MTTWRRFAAVVVAAAAAAAVPLSVAGGNEQTDDPASHYDSVPSPPPARYMEVPECTPGYECGDSGHGDVPTPS